MLEVKILLSDLDYDDVADLVVPLVSDRWAAKGGLIGKIAGKKEELERIISEFNQGLSPEINIPEANKSR